MSLQNLVQRNLVSCSPDTTVQQAARLMDSENIGAVLVCEDNRPVGIVTDRDLVIRCVVQGNDCSQTPVSDIMTTDVETVSLEDGVFDVIQTMRDNKIRRVPVVDSEGCAVGLLSFGDVFHLLGSEISALTEPAAPEIPKIVDKAA